MTGIRFDTEAVIQKETIESRPEQLNEERESPDAAVKKAADVAAGS